MSNLADLAKLIRGTAKSMVIYHQSWLATSWRAFCVDLIGPYTHKGKKGSSIDFMCLTMIDPATSWFEIVELPTVTKLTAPTMGNLKV
jgi:hypothetical protein